MSTLSTRFTLPLPDDWTPEQALAVYDLLNDLAESIWNRYELQLLELVAPEIEQHDASQHDLFEFNDELPF
jgi:hypothetical protein